MKDLPSKLYGLLEFLAGPAGTFNGVIDLSEVKKAVDPERYAEFDPAYKSYLEGVRLDLAAEYPEDPTKQATAFKEFIEAERRKIAATLVTGATVS